MKNKPPSVPTSSPIKKILKRSPSYMDDCSPHRHEKSYDEEWVHKPLARVNTLSQSSFTFALSLRSDDKKTSEVVCRGKASASKVDTRPNSSSRRHKANTECTNSYCKTCKQSVERMIRQNADIKKLIKQKETELAIADKKYKDVEGSVAEQMQVVTESNTELYQMKIIERQKNFPVQLERIRKQYLDLHLEIDKRQKILQNLKREHLKHKLPHSSLFPEEEIPMYNMDETIIIMNERAKDKIKDDTKATNVSNKSEKSMELHYIHSGTFIRSARTNWEPSWTCCMATDEKSRGCQSNPITESRKYTQLLKSKSEKYIKVADKWSKSRQEERPGLKEFRQWSSPSMRPSATIKSFPLNRLYKTNHKSNSYTQLVPPKPLYA